jgi:exodeoxyribonuclease V alpha subunit
MINKSDFNLHNAFAQYFKDPELKPYIFALSKKMSEGHICLDLEAIPKEEEFWSGFVGDKTLVKSSNLELSTFVSLNGLDKKKPFVINNNKLYLNRYFEYETAIIDNLRELIKIEPEAKQKRIDFLNANKDFISKLAIDVDTSNYQEDEIPDWQLIGALQAYLNNFTIITGGPGTGKTTTVAKIIAILLQENPQINIALAAPTGKAAVRMKESLLNNKDTEIWGIKGLVDSLKPSTIHRLLGSIKDSPDFKKNKENPLAFDVVIVDESSMIGTPLFSKLLNAIDPKKTKLILLGDANQLASVDVGSLFGDICLTQKQVLNNFTDESKALFNSFLNPKHQIPLHSFRLKSIQNLLQEHVIELKKTFRYDTTSTMGVFTKAMIQGNVEKVKETLSIKDDSLLFDSEFDLSLFNSIVLEYANYINEPDTYKALQTINDVRVICAIKQSKEGVYNTNERIEKVLKNHFDSLAAASNLKNTIFNPSNDFYHNQPIIITKNYPDFGLFNGDIGIVRKSVEDDNLKAYFIDGENQGKLKAISPGFIAESETVFAMTIHKSQGSEFKQVLVVLPKKAKIELLTRELIYTAVTRAKEKATIQGTEDVLFAATQRKVQRASGITERILIKE